jgi:T-complex protein 1 subunit eta
LDTHIFFREKRALLEKVAFTSMSSKLISTHKEFFSKLVVNAVSVLNADLPLDMIGIKKVPGGSFEVRLYFLLE